MLDIGWSELILIGVVALIVIGPQDLPDMFRQLGRFTAKMRSMAREFSKAMEQAANESGVKDVARDLKSATSAQSLGLNAMKDAAAKFEKWDPLKNAATPSKPPPEARAATPVTTAAAPAPGRDLGPDLGPETQALLDRQAARQAIVAESTERLRALNGSHPAPAPAAPQAAAVARVGAEAPAKTKSRGKTARPAETAAPVAGEKPAKAPAKRKSRKADEA